VLLPRLRRVRWAVRATLVLGVAASVVANVLHALDNPISQAIAAWPPCALLLTVELISRVPVHRKSLAFCRLLATATIAGIAAWVSYWHMAGVAVIRSLWAAWGVDLGFHVVDMSVTGCVGRRGSQPAFA
jgi:hypothetical protein